ncbi:MAG: ABC transporter permease [Planctomycetota bacterium]
MFEAIIHVIRFELIRTMTVARVMIWIAFCCFPALLAAALNYQAPDDVPQEIWIFICYLLVPQIGSMLGLLLWATSAVGSEIEAQTWIHLSMRPRGRITLALGKYIVAVLWTASYCIVSSVLVSFLSGIEDKVEGAFALAATSLCAAIAYAAIYLLIGAVFFRRATIVAVIFSLVIEGLGAWIPATINQFTISYRLRTLMTEWSDMGQIINHRDVPFLFGDEGVFFTMLIIVSYTVIVLGIACYLITKREYPVQSDT